MKIVKSKYSLYLLVPVNICIWGYFIWVLFDFNNSPETTRGPQPRASVDARLPVKTKEYKFEGGYQDPFLKGAISSPARKGVAVKQVKESKVIRSSPARTPDIKYFGLAKNRHTGKTSALISIDGVTHLLQIGEKVNECTVKSVYIDSLAVSWNNKRLIVRK